MFNQPVDSQIKLLQRGNHLKILIPTKNSVVQIALSAVYKILQAIVSSVAILLWLLILHHTQFNRTLDQKDLEAFIHFVPIVGLMLSPLVLKNVFDLFGRVTIQIGERQVWLSYSLFNLKFYYVSEEREELIKIVKRFRQHSRNKFIVWQRIPLTDEIRLTIYSRKKSLDIRSNNISEIEVEWLTVLLAQQLYLPIQEETSED